MNPWKPQKLSALKIWHYTVLAMFSKFLNFRNLVVFALFYICLVYIMWKITIHLLIVIKACSRLPQLQMSMIMWLWLRGHVLAWDSVLCVCTSSTYTEVDWLSEDNYTCCFLCVLFFFERWWLGTRHSYIKHKINSRKQYVIIHYLL